MGAARRVWDAAKHPRGPGGRFVSAGAAPGPASPSRPSLSDAVLGTAGLGPKRQRSARDLMGHGTAAPSSRAPVAAKPSATFGYAAEPKVAAAMDDIRHAVERRLGSRRADDWVGLADVRSDLGGKYDRLTVDKALMELGTHGSDMRVVPVANRKSLTKLDKAASLLYFKPGMSDPDHTGLEATADMIQFRPDQGPGMSAEDRARFESEVPGGFSRDALDAWPDSILPAKLLVEREADPNSPKVAQLEREIARRGVGKPKTRPKAAPKRTARAVFDAAGVTSELRRATSMTSARAALQGLTVAQLREVGASAGYKIPAGTKKAQAVDRLAEIAGRRLDSLAIERSG